MSPPSRDPRWSARSQRNGPDPHAPRLRADALRRNARAQDRNRHRKAEPTRRSFAVRGHGTNDPERARSSLHHPNCPQRRAARSTAPTRGFRLLPVRRRERPAAGVRKRTLTNRFQPGASAREAPPTRVTTAKRPPPHRHRSAEAAGRASWLELRGALAGRGSLQRTKQQRRLPRRPPRSGHRRSDTEAPGRLDGRRVRAPKNPHQRRIARGRESVRAAKCNQRGSHHRCRHRWRSRHRMRREATFEGAPERSVQVHRQFVAREVNIGPMIRLGTDPPSSNSTVAGGVLLEQISPTT